MVLSLFFTFSGEYMYSKVYVEISNICNMNCSFCHGHSRAPRKMSMGEFSFILDQLTEHTKYLYYHLMGEPLIHPQLPDFIKMAGERGYKSIITTNGSPPTYSTSVTNNYLLGIGGPQLPSTGTSARLMYVLCGGSIMLASLVYGIRLRRKRERRQI